MVFVVESNIHKENLLSCVGRLWNVCQNGAPSPALLCHTLMLSRYVYFARPFISLEHMQFFYKLIYWHHASWMQCRLCILYTCNRFTFDDFTIVDMVVCLYVYNHRVSESESERERQRYGEQYQYWIDGWILCFNHFQYIALNCTLCVCTPHLLCFVYFLCSFLFSFHLKC